MLSTHPDIRVTEGVYPPSEDSDLLLSSMMINSGERVLDMGTGSGFLAIEATRAGGIVTAVDISPDALDCARQNVQRNDVNITLIRSDLFSEVEGTFDVILFNPPYLPTENWSRGEKGDRTWDGEGDGSITIQRFLDQLPARLNELGRCYLLFSSLSGNGMETINGLLGERFRHRETGRLQLLFETLFVYELIPKNVK